jgi:hypothetical protein
VAVTKAAGEGWIARGHRLIEFGFDMLTAVVWIRVQRADDLAQGRAGGVWIWERELNLRSGTHVRR